MLTTFIYGDIPSLALCLFSTYFMMKYIDTNKIKYPIISYFLMAMEESWRGNGWYSEDIGEYALKNIDKAKEEYKDRIKNRLEYFLNNKKYAIDFYIKKVASMWTENTYSAVRSNIVNEEDDIENTSNVITFYEKAMLLTICLCTCIFLLQNRKNISIDVIFLLTIFIGGFTFHILWEAKSRYIIPYIIVLLPIASMHIDNSKIINIIKNIYNKVKIKEG